MKESNFAFSYHLRMLYMAVRTASHAGIEDIDSALTSNEQKKWSNCMLLLLTVTMKASWI